MEWNDKIQLITDYVENHLQRRQEPIDGEEISRIAGCSYGFFQKVFSYLYGISFSEYVRARKLTLAGYDLKSTDRKVVDVSYQYGYESPTPFAKAFQKFHGVSPKEARNRETSLKVVPKMRISVKQQYTWRLEQKPSFRLIGKSLRLSGQDKEKAAAIPEFWAECRSDSIFSRLALTDEKTPCPMFGLFLYDEKRPEEMEYFIMIKSCKELQEGFTEITIPENVWAVFDCVGPVPQTIQNGWKYLQEEWLVSYPFQHANCPELEWYGGGNACAADYLSQIWIPVEPLKPSERPR